jgi:hypothetical protein
VVFIPARLKPVSADCGGAARSINWIYYILQERRCSSPIKIPYAEFIAFASFPMLTPARKRPRIRPIAFMQDRPPEGTIQGDRFQERRI